MQIKKGKATTFAMLVAAMLVGAVLGVVIYTWTYQWTIGETEIQGVVSVEAVQYEVGYPQTIIVNITNNRAENSSGYLTVTIENANGTVATLYPRTYITINANSTWSNSWEWTPDTPDTYTAKTVYEES